ncbi:D-lactate dehydrogenase [Bisporella sp. PMI_857]|nr:D-lactate dehydrogenase [Bisporella sp. PMI_857]
MSNYQRLKILSEWSRYSMNTSKWSFKAPITRNGGAASFHRSYSSTRSTKSGRYFTSQMLKVTAGVGTLSFGAALAITQYTTAAQKHPNIHLSHHESVVYQSTRPLKHLSLPTYDQSAENLKDAQEEFVKLLGPERVIDDLGTRIAHSSTAWSESPHGDLDRPCFVLYPQSTEEVSQIAKICHRRRLPSIGFSGGTSLEGTLAAVNGEVCINFSKMNKVLALHKRDMDVVVQPGVGYLELNEQLAGEGLFFPPDPGPGAQIGGMVSQGCSGTNAFRYGTMKDWVLGMTVVLADGTIIKTRHRPRKSSAGYNLTQLMVGSEGTLGYVTEVTCKLTGKPENVRVATAAFQSTDQAVNTAIKLAQSGLPIAAMELLDDVSIYAVNESGHMEKRLSEIPTLFIKFSGPKNSIQEQIVAAKRFSKEEKCISFQFSRTDEEASNLWEARKTALWSILALKRDPEDKFLSADAAVPMSRLAEIIDKTNQKIRASGFIGSCIGHVGDGNFHAGVLYNAKDKEKAREIISYVQKMAVEMEGTITGEHGIGLEYRDMLVYELGAESVDAMRQIKLALDPLCLLNPGKMIRLETQAQEEKRHES